MSRLLMLLPVALLVVSGCSDGDPAPAAPTPTFSISVGGGGAAAHNGGLRRLYAGDNPDDVDLLEARCFAQRLVERLDEDALRDAGILDDSGVMDTLPVFDETTAQAWVDAELSCVSYVDAATRAFLVQSKGAVDADAFGACLKDAISDDQVRAALVDLLSGDYNTAEVEALTTTQADCAESSRS